jgi:hypothetical protein
MGLDSKLHPIDQNNPSEAEITMRLLDLDIIRCVTSERGRLLSRMDCFW